MQSSVKATKYYLLTSISDKTRMNPEKILADTTVVEKISILLPIINRKKALAKGIYIGTIKQCTYSSHLHVHEPS